MGKLVADLGKLVARLHKLDTQLLADLIFVDQFTRPNFQAKKTDKSRLFSPAIKQRKYIKFGLFLVKYNKMCKFVKVKK